MAWIENKRVVVTGATSGIGRDVATRLAAAGADVVLACRDVQRGEQVAAGINAAIDSERATVMAVDTSDPASITAFASAFREAYDSLDVLVNNAGVLAPERRTTAGGTEVTFATNVLGYYLVTSALLDVLRAGAPSRIVNVASTFAFDLDLDDLQYERRPYAGLGAYAQSKACDRMLTWAFARRLDGEPVTVNAMAPGLVLDTALYRELPDSTKGELAQYGSRSVPEGADTVVWLATADGLENVSGRFFEQCAEVPCQFRDEVAEERLVAACEQLVEASGDRKAATSPV